jgi:hypothetical protein
MFHTHKWRCHHLILSSDYLKGSPYKPSHRAQHPHITHTYYITYHISYSMCNSRPTQLITPAETPKAEEEKRDPATLNPQKKVCLAKLFMHNPKFAEAFFKARIGMSPLFFSFSHLSLVQQLGQTILGEILIYRRRRNDPISCPSSPYYQNAKRGIEGDNGSKSRGNLDPPLSIL